MRKIFKGIHQFQTNYFTTHQELFERLSLGQHPRILFITCSDSRIDPNLLTQTEPGELFIIRNVGNIIPPYGATAGGEGAAIEYAIKALGIKHIIVCGHSHCGAVKGLLQVGNLSQQMPLVYDWLKYAEGTRQIIEENYQDYEGEDLLNAAIEENILTQIENLRTYPAVHAKLYKGELEIHAWVYKIETGGVYVYSAERCNIKAHHEDDSLETLEGRQTSNPNWNGNGKVGIVRSATK
ncbi:MAG TPA: carbonate dehydratase [Cyanobacteria bacterium UBA8803]|nr:carbonate dehydratase [Cyanobacteria bacterium UBA9273]HBL58384.1 carbonate dehydratase [Cyanobacteria bacterium UBA8803]